MSLQLEPADNTYILVYETAAKDTGKLFQFARGAVDGGKKLHSYDSTLDTEKVNLYTVYDDFTTACTNADLAPPDFDPFSEYTPFPEPSL